MKLFISALLLTLVLVKPLTSLACDLNLTKGPWDKVRNERMIDLLIKTGIDFKPGDNVIVRGEKYQTGFMKAVIDELKKRGAGDVHFLPYPNHADVKAAIASGESPEILAKKFMDPDLIQNFIKGKYSSIRVLGANESGTPAGYDSAVWSKYGQAVNEAIKPYVSFMAADNVPWTLIELPTPDQARRAIPEQSPEEALQTFKEMVAGVFWLNVKDPAQLWLENAAKIEARGAKLNALKLKKLHYAAQGTDFTVELHDRAYWKGGRHFLETGRKTIANFPGFENFVTPKYKSTQGRVQVQRPVEVMGTLVSGAWFEFENGKVIKYGAKEGKDVLKRYFEWDPRNRYLGEVAFVDNDSPVLAQKRLFYSIVFDENALSHIALGSGYSHTFSPPHPDTEEGYAEIEMNSPAVKGHVDFMIGAHDMTVTGETYDGNTLTLMKDGKIVLE